LIDHLISLYPGTVLPSFFSEIRPQDFSRMARLYKTMVCQAAARGFGRSVRSRGRERMDLWGDILCNVRTKLVEDELFRYEDALQWIPYEVYVRCGGNIEFDRTDRMDGKLSSCNSKSEFPVSYTAATTHTEPYDDIEYGPKLNGLVRWRGPLPDTIEDWDCTFKLAGVRSNFRQSYYRIAVETNKPVENPARVRKFRAL
jgi:hypothetical protein